MSLDLSKFNPIERWRRCRNLQKCSWCGILNVGCLLFCKNCGTILDLKCKKEREE